MPSTPEPSHPSSTVDWIDVAPASTPAAARSRTWAALVAALALVAVIAVTVAHGAESDPAPVLRAPAMIPATTPATIPEQPTADRPESSTSTVRRGPSTADAAERWWISCISRLPASPVLRRQARLASCA